MNQKRTFLLLGVIAAVLILGVAYAAIQNVTLSVAGNVTASPDQGNFKVAFTGNYTFTGYPVSNNKITAGVYNEEREGYWDVENSEFPDGNYVYFEMDNLSVKGDKGVMKFEIKNSSTDIAAILSATASTGADNLGYYNEGYFKTSCSLDTTTLNPGGTTWLTVTVELIKTPIEKEVKAGAKVNIIATPTQS